MTSLFCSSLPFICHNLNQAFKCQQVLSSFEPSLFLFQHIHHAAPASLCCFHFVSDHIPAITCQKTGGRATYLFTDRSRHRHGKGTDISAAQVLPFALVTEELQFTFLLVIQAVAVTDLEPKMATHVQVTQTPKSTGLVCVTIAEKSPFVLRREKTLHWLMGLPQ